jgi:hypothetical protein
VSALLPAWLRYQDEVKQQPERITRTELAKYWDAEAEAEAAGEAGAACSWHMPTAQLTSLAAIEAWTRAHATQTRASLHLVAAAAERVVYSGAGADAATLHGVVVAGRVTVRDGSVHTPWLRGHVQARRTSQGWRLRALTLSEYKD